MDIILEIIHLLSKTVVLIINQPGFKISSPSPRHSRGSVGLPRIKADRSIHVTHETFERPRGRQTRPAGLPGIHYSRLATTAGYFSASWPHVSGEVTFHRLLLSAGKTTTPTTYRPGAAVTRSAVQFNKHVLSLSKAKVRCAEPVQ